MNIFKSERELFFWIWQNRAHVCTNCKKYLGEEARAHYFDHIKTKGSAPKERLNPDNIRILCMDCHYDRHNNPDKFKKKKK